MSHSFQLRLTLRFAALVTLTTGLLLVVGGWLLQHQAMKGLRELHAIEGGELGEILGRVPLAAAEVAQRITHDADTDAALFFLQVRDAAGGIVFRSGNLGSAMLPVLGGQGRDWEAELPAAGRVLISDFHEGPWHIQVASRLEPTNRMMANFTRVSGLLLAGAALLGLTLGHQFGRATLRPVRAIEATARRISAENLSERIPVAAGYGELTALIELLNGTFDRLQRSFDQVQRFTAEASHELKTPLALARLNAEKLRARLSTDPEAEALAAEVLEEIARLNRIIVNLLFLAKSEGGALRPALRQIDLAALLLDFTDDAAALAEDVGVRFVLARNDAGLVAGDPGLLRQLLLNLLSNALAVSARDSAVTLTSRCEADGWWLELVDEGPGLPVGQLERVFERFVRHEDGSRCAPSDGAGLGLAICRGIVGLHGGRILAVNRTDRSGLCVRVWLPTPQNAGE